MGLIELLPLFLRLVCVIGTLLLEIGALCSIIKPISYTYFIVSVYAFIGGLVVFVAELSPRGLSTLLVVFPFLANNMGRGLMFIVLGLLTLGGDMMICTRIGGVLLLSAGVGCQCIHVLLPGDITVDKVETHYGQLDV
eukprot:GHVR01016373.1.p1 GENE.GHVR01016373.1~~GHVR01016373.1.p1  ORF type:complete len:146 (+),score=25.99 GHVR01016373.1:26-439(+)